MKNVGMEKKEKDVFKYSLREREKKGKKKIPHR
jgi:hypothetical protein